MTNAQEFARRSDPFSPDTDGDGLLDAVETGTGIWVDASNTGTSPGAADTDGDGVPDPREIPGPSGSNPNLSDTDADGFPDGAELGRSNPSSKHSTPSLGAGLVAHWRFDGDLQDARRRFDGVAVGGNTFVDGRFGRALLLSGDGQAVSVSGDENAFDFVGQSMTVSGWFRYESFSAGPVAALISKGLNRSWYVGRIRGKTDLAYITGEAETAFASRALAGTGFHHFVAVQDQHQRTRRVYVDGSRVSPGRLDWDPGNIFQAIQDSEDSLTIGGVDGARRQWAGSIDDVAIWNRALTDVEASSIYVQGTSENRSLADLVAEEPGSGFSITSVRRSPKGAVTLRWPNRAGAAFRIQRSGRLLEWQNIAVGLRGEEEVLSFTDPDADQGPLFYRVIAE